MKMNVISQHVIQNEFSKTMLPVKLHLQFFAATMLEADAINGKSGECFITIRGRRYNFAQIKNLQADMEKLKTKVAILGRMSAGNKANGVEYTGSGTMYYNTSILREILYHYKETGEDIYFDIQVTNDDPSSAAGRQTIILIRCNLDGGVIALLDVEAEVLEEDISFTFEDWEMPEKFSILASMQ